MNIWKRKRLRSGLSTYEVAKALNVDEEKYLEVEEGKREMPKSHIDDFLVTTDTKDTKLEKNIRDIETMQWFKETDLKELRKEFNRSQREIEIALGLGGGILSRIENNKWEGIGIDSFQKIYDYYHNEFNKKVESEPKEVVKKLTSDQNKCMKWYTKTDLRKLRKESGYTGGELAKIIGIDSSTLYKIERKERKENRYTSNIKKLYDFYNTPKETEITLIEITLPLEMAGETISIEPIKPITNQSDKISKVFIEEIKIHNDNISKAENIEEIESEIGNITTLINLYNKIKNGG